MPTKIARNSFLLVGAVLIFVLGVLVGTTLYGPNRDSYLMLSSLPSAVIETNKESKSIKDEALKSFSIAYNKTHLWSMRLADENYYRIARLLSCRTVNYAGGPKIEPMNTCDESVINEFSVATTIHAQKWLYEHQHPADCTNKKFAIIHQFAWSGFGSTVHQIVWALGVALAEDRIAVYERPGNWVRK
jgi:hypothetical protein